MAGRIILFLALWLWASVGFADEVSKNKGVLVGFHNGGLTYDSGVQFNYNVSFRIWSLLSEPVYNVNFTWSFDERARIRTPGIGWGDQELPVNALISELDGAVVDTIRPYEVRVRIDGHMDGTSRRYFVEWDVGVPGASGSTSYNTPASPSWEDLFDVDSQTRGVNEEEAKKVFKAGFIADSVRIVTVKWSTDEYERDLRRRFPRGKREALERAARRHIGVLKNLQGLDAGPLEERLRAALSEVDRRRGEGDASFMGPLERLVGKLGEGLPNSMRNRGLEAEYQAALSEIDSDYRKNIEQAQGWIRLPDPGDTDYARWEVAKRAELAARKVVPGGNLTGEWKAIVNWPGVSWSDAFQMGGTTMNTRRCSRVDDRFQIGSDINLPPCNRGGSQCSVTFADDMRFEFRAEGERFSCAIGGTYEYTSEDTMIGRSDDDCFSFKIGKYYQEPYPHYLEARDFDIDNFREFGYTCQEKYEEYLYTKFTVFLEPAGK